MFASHFFAYGRQKQDVPHIQSPARQALSAATRGEAFNIPIRHSSPPISVISNDRKSSSLVMISLSMDVCTITKALSNVVIDTKTSPSEGGGSSGTIRFFALPPEIRNAVYALLVIIRREPIPISSSREPYRKMIRSCDFVQLLCVNRQMNDEVRYASIRTSCHFSKAVLLFSSFRVTLTLRWGF